jgi:hypothetical protein
MAKLAAFLTIARANIYGTIPYKNAVIRLTASLADSDFAFNDKVKTRNMGLSTFKSCKAVEYVIIVMGRKARQCAYATKVLQRVDEGWVK